MKKEKENLTNVVHKKLLHITHDDSDAIGCALVEELFFPEKFMETKTLVTVNAGAKYADEVILRDLLHLDDDSFIHEIYNIHNDLPTEIAIETIFDNMYRFVTSNYRNSNIDYDLLIISDHDVSQEMAFFLNIFMLVYAKALENKEFDDCDDQVEFEVLMFDHHKSAYTLFYDYDWVYMPEPGVKDFSACFVMYNSKEILMSKSPLQLLPTASCTVSIDGKTMLGLNQKEIDALEKVVWLISYYDTFAYKKEKTSYENMLKNFFPDGDIYTADYVSNALEVYSFDDVLKELKYWYTQNLMYVKNNETGAMEIVRCDKTSDNYFFEKGYIFPPKIEFINENVIKEQKFHLFQDIYLKARIIKFGYENNLHDCVVFLSCRGDYVSEEMFDLISKNDNIHIGIIIFPESKEISLRSDGTVDVQKIAREFGGGGHQEAAGFHVDTDQMLMLLKTYYSGELYSAYNQRSCKE